MNPNGFNSGAEHAREAQPHLEHDLSRVVQARALLVRDAGAAPLIFEPNRAACPPHVGDRVRPAGGEIDDLLAALRLDARRLLAEVHRKRTRDRARRRSELRPRGRHAR